MIWRGFEIKVSFFALIVATIFLLVAGLQLNDIMAMFEHCRQSVTPY